MLEGNVFCKLWPDTNCCHSACHSLVHFQLRKTQSFEEEILKAILKNKVSKGASEPEVAIIPALGAKTWRLWSSMQPGIQSKLQTCRTTQPGPVSTNQNSEETVIMGQTGSPSTMKQRSRLTFLVLSLCSDYSWRCPCSWKHTLKFQGNTVWCSLLNSKGTRKSA